MTRSMSLIIAGAAFASVSLAGCGDSSPRTTAEASGAGDQRATSITVAPKYVTVFGSIEEFVELPELIAVVRVMSERDGDSRQAEEVAVSERVLSLEVEEALAGPVPSQVEVVDFGRIMTPEGQREQVAEDGIRLRPGDRALVAISRYGDNLRFVNNQAVYLLADGEVTDTDRDDPVIRRIEQLTERQIKDKVSQGRRNR